MENFQKPSVPDGAFERFLTAALATIITIMFSWRLLAEENEGADHRESIKGAIANQTIARRPSLDPSDNNDDKNDKDSGKDSAYSEISLCGVDLSISEKEDELVLPVQTSAQVDQDGDAEGDDYCPSDGEDSPSWANYSWEEDMYGSIHTRRSARDFVSSARQNNMTNDTGDPSTPENKLPVSPEQLEELYVNREYRSIVDNTNFEQMNISDSSESDSDEGEFDLKTVDSEDDIYYPKPLEPIIEEDSDDYDESASETDSDDINYISNQVGEPVSEPHVLSAVRVGDIPNDEQVTELNHNTLKNDQNSETSDPEGAFRAQDKFCPEESENKSDLLDYETVIDDFNSVCQEFEDIGKVYDDDSIPSSPIRTYAIDDEGNLSDESCSTCSSSSASVITVVSVDAGSKSQERVESSVTGNTSSNSTPEERDELNNQEMHDKINTDLIAFIHEQEKSNIEQSDPLFSAKTLREQTINTEENSITYNSVKPCILNDNEPRGKQHSLGFELSDQWSTSSDVKGQGELTPSSNDDNSQLNYEDFVNNIGANSEKSHSLDVNEITGFDCEIDNIDKGHIPKSIAEDVKEQNTEAHVGIYVNGNGETKPRESGSESSQSDEEIKEFDDNVQPREYNPYDDDLCDFMLDQESDDDSFFVFIGNQHHLRKLDTVTNLDFIGKSQARDDLRNLSSSDEEKTYVFSRTEEISTEHRLRYYVKDRENCDLSSSDDNLIDVEEVDLHIRESCESLDNGTKPDSEVLHITESHEGSLERIDSGSLERIDSGSKDDIVEERIRQLNAVNAAINNNDLILPETIGSTCALPQNQDHQLNGKYDDIDTGDREESESEVEHSKLSKEPTEDKQENEFNSELSVDTQCMEDVNNTLYNHKYSGHTDLIPSQVAERHCTTDTDHLISSTKGPRQEPMIGNDPLRQTNCENDINYVALDPKGAILNNGIEINVQSSNDSDLSIHETPRESDGVLKPDINPDIDLIGDKSLPDTDKNGFPSKSDILDTNENLHSCDESNNNNETDEKNLSTLKDLEQSVLPCIEMLLGATQNENEVVNSETTEQDKDVSQVQDRTVDYKNYERNLEVWNKYLDTSSRVACTPVQTPSTFNVNGIKAKIRKSKERKSNFRYNSVLLQPISTDVKAPTYSIPTQEIPICRQKISVSKHKFLSAENLAPDRFKEQFAQHKTSFTQSLPRQKRYIKRDHVSTKQPRRNMSMDRIDHISNYYASRYMSDESFEKPELDALHENCIFTPTKHREILDTTQSIDNLNSSISQFESNLSRYGSVASLETDIDSGETHETLYIFPDTNLDTPFGFQHLHQRSYSMSELATNSSQKPKSSRGRFAERNFKKAKSLQTLETNIDDVFTAKGEGNLTRVPSVHELRVSKSLQKLNVPEWFKNSSVSRSGSTFSLYGSQRRDSTSTTSSFGYPLSIASSPCPSTGPGGNPVVIKTRVIPHSHRLIRSPKLPMTPERAPIAPTDFKLPSDKLRKKEKPKELMPIPIVPFSKLRLMFETKSSKNRGTVSDRESPSKLPSKSPTTPEPPTPSSVTHAPLPLAKVHEPPVSKTQEMTKSVSNPVKLPPPILKKPGSSVKPTSMSPTSSDFQSEITKVEKTVIQDMEFTNGDLDSEPYSQRRNPRPENHQGNGNVKKPEQKEPDAPKYQNEHNSKPVGYDKAPQSQKPTVQPKPNSRKLMSRKPVAANATSQESRKGKVSQISESHVSDFRQFRKRNDYGKLLFEFLQKLRFSRYREAGPTEQCFNTELGDTACVERYATPEIPTSCVDDVTSFSLKGADDDQIEHNLHGVITRPARCDTANSRGRRYSANSLEEVLAGLLALKEQSSFSGSETELAKMCCDSVDSLDSEAVEIYGQFTASSYHSADDSFSKNNGGNFADNDSVLFRCQKCLVTSILKYAKHSYRTCPYCLTFYCGRRCLLNDWQSHKLQCIYGQISSACKQIIRLVNHDPELQYKLSRAARLNYLSHGQGGLLLYFSDLHRAENFLKFGLSSLEIPPLYLSRGDIKFADVLGSHTSNLVEICSETNFDAKFVVHVVIVVPENLPEFPVPRNSVPIVQKSAILRLSPIYMLPRDLRESSSPLFLSATRGSPDLFCVNNRELREKSFMGIQKTLWEKGVSLRHDYPVVYDQLINYVVAADYFSPVIIYPFNKWQQRRFMCVIIYELDSEIEWLCDPDLADELKFSHI